MLLMQTLMAFPIQLCCFQLVVGLESLILKLLPHHSGHGENARYVVSRSQGEGKVHFLFLFSLSSNIFCVTFAKQDKLERRCVLLILFVKILMLVLFVDEAMGYWLSHSWK